MGFDEAAFWSTYDSAFDAYVAEKNITGFSL